MTGTVSHRLQMPIIDLVSLSRLTLHNLNRTMTCTICPSSCTGIQILRVTWVTNIRNIMIHKISLMRSKSHKVATLVATLTQKRKTPIFRIFLQFSSMSYIKNTTPRISSELVPVNLVSTSRHWWVSMVNAGRTLWNAKIGQRWSKHQMSNLQSGYPKHSLRRDGADHQIWQLARA